jgi:hypothetical protein
MFSNPFKKVDPALTADQIAPAEPLVAPEHEWQARLQAALGDDAALLALAGEAQAIDIKLAAVAALSSEAALKQAEHEFRTHDRRVHREAKQRYLAAVTLRESRQTADALIAEATALTSETMIPANRLVELDQAWRALDAALLEESQRSHFAGLQAKLAEHVRESGERKRSLDRWASEARHALDQWHAQVANPGNAALTTQELLAVLTASSAALRDTHATLPSLAPTPAETKSIAAVTGALESALQQHLMLEEGLKLAEVTQQQNDQKQQHQEKHKEQKAAKQAQTKAQQEAQMKALLEVIEAAEAALAAGHVADAIKHLPTLQAATETGHPVPALHSRIEKLQAEIVRLKSWQRWGGGRVRDELVAEAETLAQSVAATEQAGATKVPVAQLEKYIDQLRERWKELDRLGGATGKPLWQRFDTALKAAYVPVAAHKSHLKEVRLENLAVREKLLVALDAVRVEPDETGAAPDWKQAAQTLHQLQTEWRKLGPLEHTVPHKKVAAMDQHLKTSIARIQDALQSVHGTAKAEREQLVARAKALSQHAGARDLMTRLRDLQAEWQRHARSLPLPHKLENALWAEFKAATDAVMNEREAAFSARKSEFATNNAAREALIARLTALTEDTPTADLRRTLSAVDSEWRSAGEMAKDQAARLTARFHAARDRVQELIAGSARRIWSRSCDALLAKLALCDEREANAAGEPTATPELEGRWAELPALPARWEQAVQTRFKVSAVNNNQSLNKLLLQLESALEIPSPPAVEAERRQLKLLALKNALESRSIEPAGKSDIETLSVAIFASRNFNGEQKSRLASIVEALRRAGPGSANR